MLSVRPRIWPLQRIGALIRLSAVGVEDRYNFQLPYRTPRGDGPNAELPLRDLLAETKQTAFLFPKMASWLLSAEGPGRFLASKPIGFRGGAETSPGIGFRR